MPTLITLVDGTVPVAADFNGNYTALNNAIGSSTTISAWSTGEIPYASATNTLSRLSPGSVGKVLTMGASVPQWDGGAWVSPAFNAGNFTASGSQTWTVGSGDVATYAYLLVGKTMTVSFNIQNSSVGGTPSSELRIAIPAGQTSVAGKVIDSLIRISDAGAALTTGYCEVGSGATAIQCFKDLTGVSNWSAATDTTIVIGQITFEVA